MLARLKILISQNVIYSTKYLILANSLLFLWEHNQQGIYLCPCRHQRPWHWLAGRVAIG